MDYLELEQIKNRLIEVANKSEREIFEFITELMKEVDYDSDEVVEDFTETHDATDMVDVELDIAVSFTNGLTKEKLLQMLNDCDSLKDLDLDYIIDVHEDYEVSWSHFGHTFHKYKK